MHESTLIERVLNGDRAAFEVLVERHQGAVYGYLRSRLLQACDAEDMTQEVFLRFYLTRTRFDRDSPLRPWLLGIARNLLKEHSRRRRRRKEITWTQLCLEAEDTTPPVREADNEVLDHLPGCLDSLGPSARQAVDLRYRANLRLAVIGEKLRRSEGAVKLLMYRARQALKHCLDNKLRRRSDD